MRGTKLSTTLFRELGAHCRVGCEVGLVVMRLVVRLVTGVPVRAAPAVSRAGAPPARSLIIFLSISVLLFSPACLVSASQDGVQPTTTSSTEQFQLSTRFV